MNAVAWFVVYILPRAVARWLIWGQLGQRIPIPASWIPYVFGRSVGARGQAVINARASKEG